MIVVLERAFSLLGRSCEVVATLQRGFSSLRHTDMQNGQPQRLMQALMLPVL